MSDHPLSNPDNWDKPKTWVVPLSITMMVDDPEAYDTNMEDLVKKILNEFRAISRNLDRSGKQLLVVPLPHIKDPEKIKFLKQGKFSVQPTVTDDSKLKKMLEDLLKEKGIG